MKKIAMLLALAALIMVLAACSKKDPSDTDTDASSEDLSVSVTDTESGEPVDNSVYIIKDGQPIYTLVRPDRTNDHISDLAMQIYNSVLDKTDIKLEYINDWINPTITYDENLPEILIGKTNRAESKQVLSSTPLDGFTVKRVNNKIVIAAHTAEKLTEAYSYFISNSLKVVDGEKGKSLVYTGDHIPEQTNVDFFFNENNKLGDFVIVCADTAKDKKDANSVAKAIKSAYGISLEVVADTAAEVEKEIIIGKTSRSFGAEYINGNKKLSIGEYLVYAQGTKLLVLPGSKEASSTAIKAFCENTVASDYSDTMIIVNNSEETYPSYYGSNTSLSVGSDLRIMSYNILAELWNDQLPIVGRDARVAATILAYSPDVIGIQEVTEGWYEVLPDAIGGKYEFVYPNNPNGQANYSTLAYNKETVELVDKGFKFFTYGNSPKLRIVCWGLFKRISDGKQFIVANTHWDLTTELRLREANDQSEYLLELIDKYKVPLFSTGDFNCGSQSQEFKKYIELSGFKDSISYAEKSLAKYKSYHKVGSLPTSTDALSSIDHITCTSNVKVQYFRILTTDVVIDASDHCAIYADCSLE